MLKFLKYAFIIWFVGSILTLPLYWPYVRMFWVFMPSVTAPNFEPPNSTAEGYVQDITYLRTLTNYDRAFSETENAAFEAALDSLETQVDTLSESEFYMGVTRAVAFAENGHTTVSRRPQYSQFNTVNVRFYGFADGLYIVSAAPELADKIGARLLTIDGKSVADIMAELATYKGGNAAWKALAAPMMIESPELLAAADLIASPDGYEITLEMPGGETETLLLEGQRPDDPSAVPYRSAWKTLAGVPDLSHGAGWPHSLDGIDTGAMRYLRDGRAPLSFSLPENGFYIRSLAGFVAGDRSIPAVYNDTVKDLQAESLDYLVIDFRINDGGNYLKSMRFAKTAATYVKPGGKVYLVTGPNTFSAGIVTLAMLKYYAGDKAVIVGEPMGDFEKFWAEGRGGFQLPNSGYYVYYATGYHDWEAGCKGEPYCFTMNVKHEVPAGSLAPMVEIASTYTDYAAGKDVVLDWIEAQHR